MTYKLLTGDCVLLLTFFILRSNEYLTLVNFILKLSKREREERQRESSSKSSPFTVTTIGKRSRI